MPVRTLTGLNKKIIACDQCPRLIEWCAKVAKEKRKAYKNDPYWGKPVPNLLDGGQGDARLLIVGLAPAAHGANRTGRMFTGDRSGDFLYARLYETGFANQATAVSINDGLELIDCVITATCHCAPPGNKPTREEIVNCAPWLTQTMNLLPRLRVILSLGKLAHDAVLSEYKQRGWIDKRSAYPFSHGAMFSFRDAKPKIPALLCSFHPSQQNTFTGRLTEQMLRDVLEDAQAVIAA